MAKYFSKVSTMTRIFLYHLTSKCKLSQSWEFLEEDLLEFVHISFYQLQGKSRKGYYISGINTVYCYFCGQLPEHYSILRDSSWT